MNTLDAHAANEAQAKLTSEDVAFLKKDRLLSEDVIKNFQIGKAGEYMTIPIFDPQGTLVNIRRWLPSFNRSEEKPKMMSWQPGSGSDHLFPCSSLTQANVAPKICYLVEGEMDCLCMLSHGLTTVTNTAGANSWPADHLDLFADWTVIILMDNDEAGNVGAKKRAESLLGIAKEVRLCLWPADRPKGHDVIDELSTFGFESLQEVLFNTKPYYGPLRSLAEVESKELHFAVPEFAADGFLTIVCGDPGAGKSTLLREWATTLISGKRFPWEMNTPNAEPRSIIWWTREEAVEFVLKPRMAELGVDLNWFLVVDETVDGANLPRALLKAIRALSSKGRRPVLIVDNLASLIPDDVNKGEVARKHLEPLIHLAEQTQIPVLLVHHTNKSMNTGTHRMAGSNQITAVARIVLGCRSEQSESENTLFVGLIKSNIGPITQQVTYKFEGKRLSYVERDKETFRFTTEREGPGETSTQFGALENAKEWLIKTLQTNHNSISSNEIYRLAETAGYSARTIRRALNELEGLERKRIGNTQVYTYRGTSGRPAGQEGPVL